MAPAEPPFLSLAESHLLKCCLQILRFYVYSLNRISSHSPAVQLIGLLFGLSFRNKRLGSRSFWGVHCESGSLKGQGVVLKDDLAQKVSNLHRNSVRFERSLWVTSGF